MELSIGRERTFSSSPFFFLFFFFLVFPSSMHSSSLFSFVVSDTIWRPSIFYYFYTRFPLHFPMLT